MDTLTALTPTLLGVMVLMGIATAALLTFRVPDPWAPLVAIARGVVQLAIISLILSGIITNPWLIALALIVMFSTASTVASGRIGRSPRNLLMMTTSIGVGVLTVLLVVFATGALDFTPRYVLAIGAIVIGGAMSVAALTGRLFSRSVVDHWDEVEAWLSIGATPRQSTLSLARSSVREALIPSIDQTKTTGLVVLPGAFVGAIFGGVSPLEAGRFQIVVLAALAAAGAVTAVLVARWMGDLRVKPGAASSN